MLIIGARLKAAERQALSAGWFAAAFARQKTMKPLSELLAPPRVKGGGNKRAAARLLALAAKQGKSDGSG